MASVEEIIPRKKYKLYVDVGSNGKRKRKTLTVEATGKRQANEMLEKFKKQVLDSLKLDETISFSAFKEKWLENYARLKLEDTTLEQYELMLTPIGEYFDDYNMIDIKALNIEEFFNHEEKEGRASLVAKYKVLKSMFKYAVIWKVMKKEDNPMDDVEKPKETNKQPNKDFYRTEELSHLFKLTVNIPEHQQLIIKLALSGGLRRGEVIGICEDVCNFNNDSILIKRSVQQSQKGGLRLKGTKSEDTRIVFFPKKLMKELEIYYQKRKRLSEKLGPLWTGFKDVNGKKVFPLFSNDVGKPYRPDTVTQFWNRFMVKHAKEIRRIRFHDLRHSSATYYLNTGSKEGLNIKTLQKRLGHKDIKTTLNLYGHVTDKDDQAAGGLFDDLF